MQTVGLVQPALDAAARLNGVVQAANVAAGLVDATVQLAAQAEASNLAAATEATASAVSGNAVAFTGGIWNFTQLFAQSIGTVHTTMQSARSVH